MKLLVGVTLAVPTMAGTASAAPGLQARISPPLRYHDRSPPHALRDPTTTGSLAGSLNRTRDLRDVQGRDFRSSMHESSKSPERLSTQQDLGNTSGGPAL